MTTADPRAAHEPAPTRSVNRFVSAVGGVIFLAVGALSFTALGSATMVGDNDQWFLGVFQVNGLVILIRILMGLALLLATRDSVMGSARTNLGTGVVALLVAASSPFLDTLVDGGILALTTGDYVLFGVAAVVLIGAGILFDRPTTASTAGTSV